MIIRNAFSSFSSTTTEMSLILFLKTPSSSIMHMKRCEISPLLFASRVPLLTCELARLYNKKIWLIRTSRSSVCLRPLSLALPLSLLLDFLCFSVLLWGETKGTKEREETVSFSSTVVSGRVELSIGTLDTLGGQGLL